MSARARWFLVPLVAIPLALWAWPFLWLVVGGREMPQRQDADTVIFYPTAARALLTPQKVSGPPRNLDGRYLSRSGKMDPWIKSQGFVFASQRDGLLNYSSGADLTAKAVCGFFSPGFEICTLGTQEVGL